MKILSLIFLMFLKKVSSAHQACIYLIKQYSKNSNIDNIITIKENLFSILRKKILIKVQNSNSVIIDVVFVIVFFRTVSWTWAPAGTRVSSKFCCPASHRTADTLKMTAAYSIW